MHALRHRILHYGWNPWRSLVKRSRANRDAAAALADAHRANRVLHRWMGVARSARARKCAAYGIIAIQSQRLRATVEARAALLQLSAGAHRQHRRVTAARARISRHLVHRVWKGWDLVVTMAREQREAKLLCTEATAAVTLRALRERRALSTWRSYSDAAAMEAASARCAQQLLAKVSTWLTEMDSAAAATTADSAAVVAAEQ